MSKLLFSLLLVYLTVQQCYSWKSCGGVGVKINTFSLEGCSVSSDACQLKRASNQTMKITFTPLREFKILNLTVDAVVGIVHKEFPFVEGNICESSRNIKCPLKDHFEQSMAASVYLPDKYPIIRITTTWKFLSSDGTLEGCFKEVFQVVH